MTGEQGSAAIWVLAASSLLLLVGLAGAMRAGAVTARHQAQTAADLAALAAAGQIGVGPDPCAAARSIAAANSASLTGCELTLDGSGRNGEVVVRVAAQVGLGPFGTSTVTASARAGRLAPVPARAEHGEGRGRAT